MLFEINQEEIGGLGSTGLESKNQLSDNRAHSKTENTERFKFLASPQMTMNGKTQSKTNIQSHFVSVFAFHRELK